MTHQSLNNHECEGGVRQTDSCVPLTPLCSVHSEKCPHNEGHVVLHVLGTTDHLVPHTLHLLLRFIIHLCQQPAWKCVCGLVDGCVCVCVD